MHVSRIAKVLWLVSLAVVTSVVTTAVSGQVRKARSIPGQPAVPTQVRPLSVVQSYTQGRRVPINQEAEPEPLIGPEVVASSAMKRCQAEVHGHTVHIKASAELFDRRRGNSFIWIVRVFGKSEPERAIFVKRYGDQIFKLPATAELKPTFEDTIELPLPAGQYMIEAAIHRITPEWGLGGLDDPMIAPSLRGPRGTHLITLTD